MEREKIEFGMSAHNERLGIEGPDLVCRSWHAELDKTTWNTCGFSEVEIMVTHCSNPPQTTVGKLNEEVTHKWLSREIEQDQVNQLWFFSSG
jgi:hypothetical protein